MLLLLGIAQRDTDMSDKRYAPLYFLALFHQTLISRPLQA
jgi:hypothetical protein